MFIRDTLNYIRDESKPGRNETWYKESEGCYFRAENIMDDPTGGHCSVSREQCMRMRWVLNNCVGVRHGNRVLHLKANKKSIGTYLYLNE